MRIATFNVNSIKLRASTVIDWMKQWQVDVIALQELKCMDDAFPRAAFEEAGYNIAIHGQKAFNGVALVSRHALEDVKTGLPGDFADDQARYIEALVSHKDGAVRVASIYLPNGNPVDTAKYTYKLAWMDRLIAHAASLLDLEEPLVLAGDYNVIPHPRDVHNPQSWLGDALFLPQTRAKFQQLLNLGLTDALRACDDAASRYSFWDYQAGAWQKDNGIRIDHLLLSPQASDRLVSADIAKDIRGHERPSDHVPVWIDIKNNN
jgi:exodeoxyribonuclease III